MAVLAAAVAVSGCGGTRAHDLQPADKAALASSRQSPPATRECGPDGAPPVPRIGARREGRDIVVAWQFDDVPGDCRPAALLITARSRDKLDNMALGPGSIQSPGM